MLSWSAQKLNLNGEMTREEVEERVSGEIAVV